MASINHKARARRAWPHLVGAAGRGQKLTYGELARKIGLHHRAAGWLLGVIQDYCAQNARPPLQALVVNKGTRIPGFGYVASPRGGAAYRRALRAVFAHQWPPRAPF